MKKILIILILGIISCNHPVEGSIITEISYNGSNSAFYTTGNHGSFWARRDLYHVGDTLKFTR